MTKSLTTSGAKNNGGSRENSSSKNTSKPANQFTDNRPETLLQLKLYQMANNTTNNLFPAQKKSVLEKEELFQGRFQPFQKKASYETLQKKENNTGLPNNLKSGIENLSGYSMDDVKVHYNSSQPAELNAHAYAQGTDIHLASGQEKHLSHEAWHVVQQKQGRVKPTFQMKGKVNVNDDVGLEREADLMGSKAMQKISLNSKIHPMNKSINSQIIQRKEITELVVAIKDKMDEGKLLKAQITEGLRKLDQTDIDDVNFPRSLVEFVKERNEITDFSITDLDEAPDPKFGKKHLTKKWTFRHYTETQHDSLRSLADLEASGIDASANTNERDWEQLGNQGYVFGLIAVDGKVPHRSWLSDMQYYAEYDLSDLSSVWVSGDMLDADGRAKGSYQGSGMVIIAQLSKILAYIDQNVETAIDNEFLGKLEAKVPPATLGKPVWRDAQT